MSAANKIKALRERITELEARIAECAHKSQGSPHWNEELERFENDLKVLKRSLSNLLHVRK